MTQSQQNVPIPDPSLLTQEALRRDIGALESLIEVKLAQVQAAIDNLEKLHDRVLHERDRRYNERFEASEEAVQLALKSARDAASGAVISQKEAVDAAFEASEKAITKAEVSIEKRADATYVALTSLQEMLGNLMTRQESEQRFHDMLERVQSTSERLTTLESMRLGAKEDRSGLYATVGIGITVALFVFAIVGFFVAGGG